MALTLVGLQSPSLGAAQNVQDEAAAEALFRRGRQLMESGDYAAACDQFAASNELDPAVGTVLNLAACLEADGRLASAWAKFVEAESLANREGSARRAAVARERAQQLEPRLIRVVIQVQAPVPEQTVTVAGRAFPEATWGAPIPMDPGTWEVSSEAPGHVSWSESTDATEEGATVEITIPVLEAEAAPEPPPVSDAGPDLGLDPTPTTPEPMPATETSSGMSGGTVATWVLVGTGLATIGAGFGIGINAKNLWDGANCPDNRCVTPGDQSDAEAARTRANVATGLIAGGGALVLGAVIVGIVTRGSDDDSSARVRVNPVVSDRGAGVTVGGAF